MEWNVDIEEFWKFTKEKQAFMIAVAEAKSKMASYEDQVAAND